MPGKDSEKLKKRKAKIKKATDLTSANKQVNSGSFDAAMGILNETIELHKNTKLDEGKIADLAGSYKVGIAEATKYLNDNANLPPAVRESVERVKRALAKDLRVLNNYEKKLKNATEADPAPDYTFNELLEVSRSKRIDVNVDAVETAGAGQHVRAVIPTEEGKLYFTESEKIGSLKDEQKKLLDSYKKKYGADADFLDDKKLTDAFDAIYATGAYRKKEAMPGMEDPMVVIATYKTVINEEIDKAKKAGQKLKIADDTAEALNRADTTEKQKIMFSYITDYAKMRLAVDINKSEGIREGCYQDKRNSAFSFIAEELGLGDLIAHSENVHIRYNDGGKKRIVKGTAMKAAKGEDLNLVGPDSNFMKMNKSSLENPALIKQVASLQVLDFLCGNCDRHGANFSYIVDENGNLKGIQGFDNDSSFGAKFVASGYNGKKVRIQDFGIIPEDLADKIMEMDKKNIEFMLHGFDLSSKEIEGACNRLQQLKNAITISRKHYKDKKLSEGMLEKNIPRIVKDENLGEYSFTKDLAIYEKSRNGKNYGNLFGTIRKIVSGGNPVNEVSANLTDVIRKNANSLVNDSWIAAAQNINKMKLENPKIAMGSSQYDKMLEETEKLQTMLKNFTGPIYIEDPNVPIKDKVLKFSSQASKIRAKMQEVDELTDKYLNERAFPRRANHKSKNSRAYKRYALAMKNKDMMADLEKKFSKIEKAYEDRKSLSLRSKTLRNEAKEKDKKLDEAMEKKIAARNKNIPEQKIGGPVK